MNPNRLIYCARVLASENSEISPSDEAHVFTSLSARESFLDRYPAAIRLCHKGELRALGGLPESWIDHRPPQHPDHDISMAQLDRYHLQLA